MNNLLSHKQLHRYNTHIYQLFWVAGSTHNKQLWKILNNLPEKEWNCLWPDIYHTEKFNKNHYDTKPENLRGLVACKKFGFFAEIHVPYTSEFTFYGRSKMPYMWLTSDQKFHIEYVYAEDTQALLKGIEIKSKKCFFEDVEKELKTIKNKS